MAIKKLGLTRDQLAMFLKDHEQIKQFENLFRAVESSQKQIEEIDIESSDALLSANETSSSIIRSTNDSDINASFANNKATDAIDSIARLSDETSKNIASIESKVASSNAIISMTHKLAQDAAISSAIADIKAEEAISRLSIVKAEMEANIAAIEAKANRALDLISQIMTDMDVLQMLPAQKPLKRTRYGQFYDTTVQTAALTNTEYPITYNTTSLSYGVFLRPGDSEIEVDTEGVYNFQFSIQVDKTSGGAGQFWIWPRLNGVDVDNSASQIRIQGNDAEIFSSANFFVDMKAGDYVEFMWAVSDTDIQLQYFAASAPIPAVPSIIVTVSNNIRGQT